MKSLINFKISINKKIQLKRWNTIIFRILNVSKYSPNYPMARDSVSKTPDIFTCLISMVVGSMNTIITTTLMDNLNNLPVMRMMTSKESFWMKTSRTARIMTNLIRNMVPRDIMITMMTTTIMNIKRH